MSRIILKKGEQIKFLDYTIKNCLNDDGLVLLKEKGELYECHLGNYGQGTQADVNSAKKFAIVHFMLARPEIFSTCIANKLCGLDGTYHEWFLFRDTCKKDNIEVPAEVECRDGMNCMIHFQGELVGGAVDK